MSERLAVLPAKGVEETRSWSWRNEKVGREGIGVFSAVTAPVYVVSHLLVDPRVGLCLRLITYDLELKEFWTRSCEKNVGGAPGGVGELYEQYSIPGFLAEGFR